MGRLKSGPERELVERYRERIEGAWAQPRLRRASTSSKCPRAARGAMTTAAPRRPPPFSIAAGAAVARRLRRARQEPCRARPSPAARAAGATRAGRLSPASSAGRTGSTDRCAQRADLVVSFGALTMPHQIVRVLVVEQLYRALTILAGHPYHRAGRRPKPDAMRTPVPSPSRRLARPSCRRGSPSDRRGARRRRRPRLDQAAPGSPERRPRKRPAGKTSSRPSRSAGRERRGAPRSSRRRSPRSGPTAPSSTRRCSRPPSARAGTEGARSRGLEQRLQTLTASEAAIRRSLESRRGVIVEVFAALQRMGRRPPPAVLVRPEDMLEAVRASILLGAVLPELRARDRDPRRRSRRTRAAQGGDRARPATLGHGAGGAPGRAGAAWPP